MKKDKLSTKELSELTELLSVLVPGEPYLWVLDFGWANIGYYVKHLTPNKILVAHCSHFANAGKDYGKIANEGIDDKSAVWRYEGRVVEINTLHVIKTVPYNGKVHRGNIISG